MPPALVFAAVEAPCLAIAGRKRADIGGAMGNVVASGAACLLHQIRPWSALARWRRRHPPDEVLEGGANWPEPMQAAKIEGQGSLTQIVGG